MVVIRSGCYLTQDSQLYRNFFARIRERSPYVAELAGGLMPALEVYSLRPGPYGLTRVRCRALGEPVSRSWLLAGAEDLVVIET
jgi:hypothetical protein